MLYTWDEKKREANLIKHELDFRDAHLVYESAEKETFPSPRHGEPRLTDLAMVAVHGRVLTLAYVERGSDIRVISLRVANRKERRIYGAFGKSNRLGAGEEHR